jgi:hypothetical protein
MLALFIHGNLWRRKIRIGKGATGIAISSGLPTAMQYTVVPQVGQK